MMVLVVNGKGSFFEQYPGDPSMQIMASLWPDVYRYYLLWAIWIPRVRVGIGVGLGLVGRR